MSDEKPKYAPRLPWRVDGPCIRETGDDGTGLPVATSLTAGDSAFIVRAANLHDEVVAALGHLIGLFAALHPNAEAWGDYGAAIAALAKARGGK